MEIESGELDAARHLAWPSLVLLAILLVGCKKESIPSRSDADPCGPPPTRSGPPNRATPAPVTSGAWGPVSIGMDRCAARDALLRAGLDVKTDPGIKTPSSYVSATGDDFNATVYFDEGKPSIVNQVLVTVERAPKERIDAALASMVTRYGAAQKTIEGRRTWSWGDYRSEDTLVTVEVTPAPNGLSLRESYVRNSARRDSPIGIGGIRWSHATDAVVLDLKKAGYDVRSDEVDLEPCVRDMPNPNPRCGERGMRITFLKSGEKGTLDVAPSRGLERGAIDATVSDEAALLARMHTIEAALGRPRAIERKTSHTFRDAKTRASLDVRENTADPPHWSFSESYHLP